MTQLCAWTENWDTFSSKINGPGTTECPQGMVCPVRWSYSEECKGTDVFTKNSYLSSGTTDTFIVGIAKAAASGCTA